MHNQVLVVYNSYVVQVQGDTFRGGLNLLNSTKSRMAKLFFSFPLFIAYRINLVQRFVFEWIRVRVLANDRKRSSKNFPKIQTFAFAFCLFSPSLCSFACSHFCANLKMDFAEYYIYFFCGLFNQIVRSPIKIGKLAWAWKDFKTRREEEKGESKSCVRPSGTSQTWNPKFLLFLRISLYRWLMGRNIRTTIREVN